METPKNKKQYKTLRVKVTPMTFYNLFKLATMMGCNKNPGRAIDKLVREKMLSLHTQSEQEYKHSHEE